MKNIYNEYKSERLLSKYIPVAKSQLVRKVDEIEMGFPLVLKIISDKALHKTDIGGVRIVSSEGELEREFNLLLEIVRRKSLTFEGILVQEKLEGQELIIGIKKDPDFGHVILFGLGGIFSEILDDVSIRKCPITEDDAQEMISELKSKQIFYGARGRKLDVDFLKNVLVKVSQVPLKDRKIYEMDINPFILGSRGGKAADARIVFHPV